MQAIVVERPGGPETLQLQQQPDPEAGGGELLVDVAAAGVNFIDVYHREGRYPKAMPLVLGREGAGTVAAVGAGVGGWSMGDRAAWADAPGGYAERVAVRADQALHVPDGVDDRTAAALPLQGLTAHYLATSTYPVADGDDVLVHAAAGGVGLLLTQIVTLRGGRVIATVSTPEKAELARAAGAAEVVMYRDEDVAERVAELTGGAGVRVVYDGVGRDTFDAGLEVLGTRGTMVLFGASSGPVPPVDPLRLSGKSLFLTRPTLAHHIGPGELGTRVEQLFGWVVAGQLDVRIGATYPLADARRAHEDLEGRRTTGKLLLIP
jgi:NADPH2:quinone reductase